MHKPPPTEKWWGIASNAYVKDLNLGSWRSAFRSKVSYVESSVAEIDRKIGFDRALDVARGLDAHSRKLVIEFVAGIFICQTVAKNEKNVSFVRGSFFEDNFINHSAESIRKRKINSASGGGLRDMPYF